MALYTISQLAKRLQVNVATIRYYERRGLIIPTMRAENNYRLYNQDALILLGFIFKSKELGFTLAEIKELLAIEQHSDEVCHTAQQKVANKLKAIEQKIASLNQMKAALASLKDSCSQCNHDRKCSVISCFTKEQACE